jgi:hypothetical protein
VVAAVETATDFPAVVDGGGNAVRRGVVYGQPWVTKVRALERGEKGASRELRERENEVVPRQQPSPAAGRCRARSRWLGRRGAPLLRGDELEVRGGYGGERVWIEEGCGALY